MLGFPFGRRALPRLDAQRVRTRKNARGFFPARQPNMSGSGDPYLQTFTEIRRARACPSPCLGLPQPARGTGPRATEPSRHRGGQAPALLQRAPLFRLLHLPKRRQRPMRRRHRAPQPTRHQRLTLTTKRYLLNLIVMLNTRLR